MLIRTVIVKDLFKFALFFFYQNSHLEFDVQNALGWQMKDMSPLIVMPGPEFLCRETLERNQLRLAM